MVIKPFLYKLYLIFLYARGKRKKYFTGREKTFLEKFKDLFSWVLRDDQFNVHYYTYGLNMKGKKQSRFIGRKEFLALKSEIEKKLQKYYGKNGISYDVITKDKFVAYSYFTANNIPCVPIIGLVLGENIVLIEKEAHTIDYLFQIEHEFVLKNAVWEAGDGFLLCKPVSRSAININTKPVSKTELRNKLKRGHWILQKKISSHSAIRKINDTALNTTRIVTILNGDTIEYLTGFQSFAVEDAAIDSWGKGAVYVGLDNEKFVLTNSGFYHPAVEGRAIANKHPDSGILFEGYSIPFLKESISLCCYAHRFLYGHFVVGWDVSITDDGPLILEANEKPGMNAVQAIDGGLRPKIRECYRNTINHLKHK